MTGNDVRRRFLGYFEERGDKLVAFSCKRRGFCPSCGARRMAQTAAHLVDHVIPQVAVRQWARRRSPRGRWMHPQRLFDLRADDRYFGIA